MRVGQKPKTPPKPKVEPKKVESKPSAPTTKSLGKAQGAGDAAKLEQSRSASAQLKEQRATLAQEQQLPTFRAGGGGANALQHKLNQQLDAGTVRAATGGATGAAGDLAGAAPGEGPTAAALTVGTPGLSVPQQGGDGVISEIQQRALDAIQDPNLPNVMGSALNSEGDKFYINVQGGGSVGEVVNVGVEGSANMSVTRVNGPNGEPQYELAVGADINGTLGAEAWQGTEIQGKLGGGGSVIYTFDSPQDAARAAGIIGQQAIAGNVPGLSPSAADRQFLTDNVSGVELRGNAALQLSAGVSASTDNDITIQGIGAQVGAGVNATHSARIDFPRDGQPGKITFNTGLNGEAAASAGVVVSGHIKAGAGIELEQTYTFTDGIGVQDIGSLLSGNAIPSTHLQAGPVKMTAFAEGEARGTIGGGIRHEFSASGPNLQAGLWDAARSGDLERFINGDIGALSGLGDVELNYSLKAHTFVGVNAGIGASAAGNGAGIGVDMGWVDQHELVNESVNANFIDALDKAVGIGESIYNTVDANGDGSLGLDDLQTGANQIKDGIQNLAQDALDRDGNGSIGLNDILAGANQVTDTIQDTVTNTLDADGDGSIGLGDAGAVIDNILGR